MHIDINTKLSLCLEWVSSSGIGKKKKTWWKEIKKWEETERERIKGEKSLVTPNTVKLDIFTDMQRGVYCMKKHDDDENQFCFNNGIYG